VEQTRLLSRRLLAQAPRQLHAGQLITPFAERERMTTRQEALEAVQQLLLPHIARLYGIQPDDLQLYPHYDGCQNLVFFYKREAADYVLRVSFRDDRSPDQILAELDFIGYLHENGVRVSPPAESQEGRPMEVISSGSCQFAVVSFERAPGHRLPDKGYKYRDGASIEEYYLNWGRLLGQMHRLTQHYSPRSPTRRRPQLLDVLANHSIPGYLPPSHGKVNERFQCLLAEVSGLPDDKDAYGLIHADFSDGNFCVDYTNGNITAFDFDDSAYCWFMYDLADAWRSGVGWTMAEADPGKRRDCMDKYFDTLLRGYTREHTLPEAWLKRLPTFLKLVEMEALLSEFRDLTVSGCDEDDDGEMAYMLKCIEDDIPFLGFFDSIYSHSCPFQLPDPS
jgi:Ser/Thr protein kinase RdoA (MazF antagonist)